MKILFLCGSLESGKDGVGDYVIRLLESVLDEGIDASAIALNDTFVEKWIYEDFFHGEKKYKVLRLDPKMTLAKRAGIAGDWIKEFDPDWLSLQYVLYSFHKKGFPFFLNKKLQNLGQGRNWHIMFHELWVGMETQSIMKLKIFGLVQKFIIRDLLKSLLPRKIHTHATVYQKQLQSRGWKVNQLPLFGNIRFYHKGDRNCSAKEIAIAVFGSIHPGAKLKEFISWLNNQNIRNYRLHFLGDNGKWLKKWIPILQQNRIEYKIFGWLPEEDMSQELYKCDLGITTTPYYLVEKSGCVAAMLEHRLEVICIGKEWIPQGVKPTKINIPVINFCRRLNIKDLDFSGTLKEKNKLGGTVHKFITDLHQEMNP